MFILLFVIFWVYQVKIIYKCSTKIVLKCNSTEIICNLAELFTG